MPSCFEQNCSLHVATTHCIKIYVSIRSGYYLLQCRLFGGCFWRSIPECNSQLNYEVQPFDLLNCFEENIDI